MRDPQQELDHLRALASADPTKRFSKLLKIVRHEAFLGQAWERLRMNIGSRTPGVDGQTKQNLDPHTIHQLAHDLQHCQYKPQPVRRVYVPKGRHQRRPLGIPALRDRMVQAAVAQILEALDEPIFRDSSYGFRPERSTIHALRHVARAYRAGATWTIEGDLVKCFDSIPHDVILTCLRKRIKDERFLDLIRQMLQAGVMEDGQFAETYSGTPQGGLCSPILMNVVLHELDCWVDDHWQANAPVIAAHQNRRGHREYARPKRNLVRWRAHLQGRLPMGRQTPDGLRRKLKEAIAARKRVPCFQPRRALYYCRYADDYVLVLCHQAKADAQHLKDALAAWLHEHLGLIQHPDKTRITHWSKSFRFLGYDARGQRNPTGTHWLRLTIPPEAERKLKRRVARLCGYTQVPALDLFMSVNAQLRGWTHYYRYASNATKRFGYLTGVVFWLTAHFLGRKHRCSITRLMRTHYGVDPRSGKRALYITRPDGKHLFIWNQPPQWRSILTGQVHVHDTQPVVMTAWAGGHSYEQRQQLHATYDNHGQQCGRESDHLRSLVVHHPHRLGRRPQRKLGPAHIIQSAAAQQVKLLCQDCHKQHHQRGGWNDGKPPR